MTDSRKLFGRKSFAILLSDIDFVRKDWFSLMEDIEHTSTLGFLLKRVEYFFDNEAEELDKEKYCVFRIEFKDWKTAVTFDKNWAIKQSKNDC
ncbi:hypothetical protein STRDD10_02003 [Streptococcus sp. DD10]|uniref:hypothetical protein n=1 Tax=Streptococcus sp. DD10 TaxID=1777878 RepID=UPI0007956217|nr:hypothetical protein [Streptococcus sp. DD10]KXT72276.1 hypothetical protein STRDD10_02003 [Streptococcus sp. DD10]